MSVQDLIDVQVEIFGGRNTSMPPWDLPAGASPLNQDLEYPEGCARSRAGQTPFLAAALTGNPSINGLKTYVTPTEAVRLMAWTALGSLYKENPEGVLALVASGNLANLLFSAENVFGRLYMAFSSGTLGGDMPRQYDDTNFDRVSQQGPGAGPAAAASAIPAAVNIASLVRAANEVTLDTETALNAQVGWTINVQTGQTVSLPALQSMSCVEGVVTVVFQSAHGLIVGAQITIFGGSDPTYTGTWTVETVPSPTSITFNAITASANDTISASGTCNTSGQTVTWESGGSFLSTWQPGANFTIGNTTYLIASVQSATSLTLETSAGDQNGVAWSITAGAYSPLSGLFIVESVINASSVTYQNLGPNGSTGETGTVTIAPQTSGGLHGVSVSFITRQGYITPPAPPVWFYASGLSLISLTGIPIGPSNVVGRLLMFTPYIPPPATQETFYSMLGAMQINDNTTTSATLDFTDSALIASFNCEYLFGQQELGECSFTGSYNSRTIWLGERNKVPNLVNMGFDGGWNLGGGTGGSDVPLGWTSDPTNGAGGSRDSVNSAWLDAYRITGDGVAAIKGMITQSVYRDWLGVGILLNNTAYSFRARLQASEAAMQGNFTVEIYSPSLGSLGLANVALTGVPTGSSVEFIGSLIGAQAVIPADALLRVYGSGTMWNTTWFTVDCLQIFPTQTPSNGSNARVSYVDNPESFDGVTGNIGVRPNDGQTLRAGFPLRNNYYLAKDHYLCYVTDDGVNEPASWTVNEVSATIGICGPNAQDGAEEWRVFAEESGFYFTEGSDPIKINQEIMDDASNSGQVCWNSINWACKQTIWVVVDNDKKEIRVGAPVNGATTPNVIFKMDYKFSNTAELISAGPGVVYSVFSGKLLTHGSARKWTVENIAAASAELGVRADNSTKLFLGNGLANGQINYIDPTSNTDAGAAIVSRYQTYGAPGHMEEQTLQLRSHRKLLGYISGRVTGSAALPGEVVSMARSGTNYVNVTMSEPHGLATGDWVAVAGASDPCYNGYQRVSVTSPEGFQYMARVAQAAATGAAISGTLNLSIITQERTTRLRGVALLGTPPMDFARRVNVSGERFICEVGTSVPGAWFQLEKLILSMKPHPSMPVAGSGGP